MVSYPILVFDFTNMRLRPFPQSPQPFHLPRSESLLPNGFACFGLSVLFCTTAYLDML